MKTKTRMRTKQKEISSDHQARTVLTGIEASAWLLIETPSFVMKVSIDVCRV